MLLLVGKRDCVVGQVSGLRSERGIVGRLLVEARDVSLLQRVQAVNGTRPDLFIGIGGAFFPEVRAAVMPT